MNGFWAFLSPSGWFLGLGLFQNMFHNPLIYTNNFCFGYITVFCFFETFPGWVGGWLENLILMKTQSSAQTWTWTWTLDFNLGFVKREMVCLFILATANHSEPLYLASGDYRTVVTGKVSGPLYSVYELYWGRMWLLVVLHKLIWFGVSKPNLLIHTSSKDQKYQI